jgi:hypothetical protein
MKYAELQEAGRRYTDRQMRVAIRDIAADPRFSALVIWLERNEQAWTESMALQALADSHGKLAHCSGSLHALFTLQRQLMAMVEAKEKKGPAMEPND